MRIDGRAYRTIWPGDDARSVVVIDQTRLPFRFETREIRSLAAAAEAIATMIVRGAPLIGVTAAYGMALAMRVDPSDAGVTHAFDALARTRPTAVNLRWALDRMRGVLQGVAPDARAALAWREAAAIADEDAACGEAIGRHGLGILRSLAHAHRRTLNVLTHCNAGWLACVDWGTALAPVYAAHEAGIDVHVWVDETRPRNQGAALTAFELGAHGIAHTVIADNAGGHLMQRGRVDVCIVGSDRATASGDVANKIGTYLKALAAFDNGVPFYAALPYSTIDWSIADGVAQVPIEERAAREVTHVTGRDAAGALVEVQVVAPGSAAANPAFDVTPARLVTGIITERGVARASRDGLAALYSAAPGARP